MGPIRPPKPPKPGNPDKPGKPKTGVSTPSRSNRGAGLISPYRRYGEKLSQLRQSRNKKVTDTPPKKGI